LLIRYESRQVAAGPHSCSSLCSSYNRCCSTCDQCCFESFFRFSPIPNRAIVSITSFLRYLWLTCSRETAAEENHTSYFPLLDRIAEETFAKAETDKELYETFVRILLE